MLAVSTIFSLKIGPFTCRFLAFKKRGYPENLQFVFYCRLKLAFFLSVYMFGSSLSEKIYWEMELQAERP